MGSIVYLSTRGSRLDPPQVERLGGATQGLEGDLDKSAGRGLESCQWTKRVGEIALKDSIDRIN